MKSKWFIWVKIFELVTSTETWNVCAILFLDFRLIWLHHMLIDNSFVYFFWNLTTTHLHQYEFNRRRRSTWIYLFSCQCSFVSPIVHRFYSNKWDNRKQFYFNPNLVLRPTSFSIRIQHFNWLVHFYPIFQLSIFFGFTMEL